MSLRLRRRRRRTLIPAGLTAVLVGAAVAAALPLTAAPGYAAQASLVASTTGLEHLKHIVVIMQENRSFDHYFGTYPGADGIPMGADGTPSVCVPDPLEGTCVKPFHQTNLLSRGGPHGDVDATADINGGKMDGFIKQAATESVSPEDVMGYYTGAEIPVYWSYADNFVLHDHFFEPIASASRAAHNFMVSAWNATCPTLSPMECTSTMTGGDKTEISGSQKDAYCDNFEPACSPPNFRWTDITELLHRGGVSWRYYHGPNTPALWNPLPSYADVHENGQTSNITTTDQLQQDAAAGSLPAVSWVAPDPHDSDHPPADPRLGQAHVSGIVNSIMNGPNWKDTAILLAWDDWGGFYDHVRPPVVDAQGYGLREPSILISPYAKRGKIDHQTLSTDAYLKLIEDTFLAGARLDPETDGRPDSRPGVREEWPGLGDLSKDFDFTSAPREPIPANDDGSLQPSPPVGGPVSHPHDVDTVGPATVSFDTSGSRSTNGIARWSLDPGDGTPALTGQGTPPTTLTHRYTTSGLSTATLKVVDTTGGVDSSTQSIGITNTGPTAQLVPELVPSPDRTVHFDGSASAPGGGDIASWRIDFGDGTTPARGTGPLPESGVVHEYAVAGDVTATLTVRDSEGMSASAPAIVHVTDPSAPEVSADWQAINPTSVFLYGLTNPHWRATKWWFEYGPTTAYGTIGTPKTAGIYAANISVNTIVKKLDVNATYHFRLCAKNSIGKQCTEDQPFSTGGPPLVLTRPAIDLQGRTATLVARVYPNTAGTTVHFEYGETQDYGTTTPDIRMVVKPRFVSVTQDIAHLVPGRTYHFRTVATNAYGTTYGVDRAFVASDQAPKVVTTAPTDASPTGATFNGKINAQGLETTYQFEWGTDTSYGNFTPTTSAGALYTYQFVHQPVALTKGIYHYRLVATSSAGTTVGLDKQVAIRNQ